MIHCKSLKPLLLAITLIFTTSAILPSLASAQDNEPSISFGQVRFGKKEDSNWLKVDLRQTRTTRFSASQTPTVSFNSAPAAPTFVNTPPTTRVTNGRLVLASRIAVSNAHSHSTRSCWRYVKSALLQAEVVDSYPRTEYAKQAGAELEQNFGFIKTNIRNPLAAPLGSVLVYGGRGAGHVEIRANEGFVSDFVSPKPSSRPLIGVYVKR